MLQFIAQPYDKYSIPEQAQMAIEAGCQWVRLRVNDMPDHELRELAAELVPLCKESATILTIEDHIEMAKELGIHGVHLRHASITPAEARELLGPEAIIGVQVTETTQVEALKGLDIDYAAFPPETEMGKIAFCAGWLKTIGMVMPIVAEGEFGPLTARQAIDVGASGVAVGKSILEADDPVAAASAIINSLTA